MNEFIVLTVLYALLCIAFKYSEKSEQNEEQQ